jgi:hypothetical protein
VKSERCAVSLAAALAATAHLLTCEVRDRVKRVRGVPSHSPPWAATAHLLTCEVRDRVKRVRGVPSHSPPLAATAHLLTFAAVSGNGSPADKRGDG